MAGRRRVLRLGLEQYRGLGGRISGVAGDRSCDDGTHLYFSRGLRLVDVAAAVSRCAEVRPHYRVGPSLAGG